MNHKDAHFVSRSYLEKSSLGGRLAVITGGGRGIGLACAKASAEAGARFVLLERDETAAQDRQRSNNGTKSRSG